MTDLPLQLPRRADDLFLFAGDLSDSWSRRSCKLSDFDGALEPTASPESRFVSRLPGRELDQVFLTSCACGAILVRGMLVRLQQHALACQSGTR